MSPVQVIIGIYRALLVHTTPVWEPCERRIVSRVSLEGTVVVVQLTPTVQLVPALEVTTVHRMSHHQYLVQQDCTLKKRVPQDWSSVNHVRQVITVRKEHQRPPLALQVRYPSTHH